MKKSFSLFALFIILVPINIFAAASSGVTLNLGVGTTIISNSNTNGENNKEYNGAGFFLSAGALLGYQHKINDYWTIGAEGGIIGSSGAIDDAVTSIVSYMATLGYSIDNISSSQYTIPLAIKTRYYVGGSGFNISGKAGLSYNHFQVSGDEVITNSQNDQKIKNPYKRKYNSIAPLVGVGVGYEFDSGFGISLDGTYSFGKTAAKATERDNIANYSTLLSISYLFK
ncbi:outer membrane beta-barrel protein [Rickettsiales bacterium LUAb2]